MANFCPNCGITVNPSETTCKSCGANLSSSERNSEYENRSNNKKWFSWSSWFIGVICGFFVSTFAYALIGVVVTRSIPEIEKAKYDARQKSCFSNQRVIQGAVEMYNMDYSTPMEKLDIPILVRNRYLKNEPTSPDPKCAYHSSGDLSKDGFVYCSFHGDVQGKLTRK